MLLNPYRFGVSGGGTDAQLILASLVSWWDFSETTGTDIADEHGSSPLLAAVDISGITASPGKPGNFANTSSNTHTISVISSKLDPLKVGDENFTVFLWHKRTTSNNPSAGSESALLARNYGADQYSYEINVTGGTPDVYQFNISADGTTFTAVSGPEYSYASSSFDFIAAGFDKDRGMAFIIVNGTRFEASHSGGAYAASTARLGVGKRVNSGGTTTRIKWGGYDSAGLARLAVTDDQYAVLYNAGAGLNYADLVALT